MYQCILCIEMVRYINALGQSFRDFINGMLTCPYLGSLPTMSDWADHLTTCFPEARIKKVYGNAWSGWGAMERRICALPAFWVGLMYDNNFIRCRMGYL